MLNGNRQVKTKEKISVRTRLLVSLSDTLQSRQTVSGAICGAAAAASQSLNIGVDVVGPDYAYYGHPDLQSFLNTISLLVTDNLNCRKPNLQPVFNGCRERAIRIVVLVPGNGVDESRDSEIVFHPDEPERLLPILTRRFVAALAESVRGSDVNGRFNDVERKRTTRCVFICYRRNDTQHAADRLHERLVDTYGSDRVFMDIDSVPLGVNFVSYIEAQLQGCAAVLVLIGPHWTNAVDEEGHRRLEDPADHVRVEIAAALSCGVPVIPLMVQDAFMPRARDLPENIRELASKNGMPMPRTYWKESVERLIKRLQPLMSQQARPALADRAPKDSIDPLSAIHKLVESRDNRRILICYPDDARLWATRIYDRVVAAHGFRAVFRIKDAHAPGPEHHTLDVSATRAAIVLFTPQALEPVATSDSDDEFYRTVAALLKANTPVIPVLVHGAAFPAPALLPEAIRPLAAMNAIRLEHTDWAVGAKQLLKELQPLMV